MLAKIITLATALISIASAAHFTSSHRLIISPYTSKTFLLHNSHSSCTYATAKQICSQYPHGRLAELDTNSGDVEFIGRYVESLDEPYWIAGLTDYPSSATCAAIYSGGAVAIPKPLSKHQSPCSNKLNVLCEIGN